METKDIKKLAIDFLVDGCFLRDFDIKRARRDYAIAWGFSRHIESLELMRICTELLERMCIDKELVKGYQEIGFETACFGINYIEKKAKDASRTTRNIPIFMEEDEQ